MLDLFTSHMCKENEHEYICPPPPIIGNVTRNSLMKRECVFSRVRFDFKVWLPCFNRLRMIGTEFPVGSAGCMEKISKAICI